MPFSAPRISQVALGIQYAGLAGAGTWLLADPSQLLQLALGVVVYGWAAFLVLGGTLCLVGTLTKIWIGEYLGLILLFFANIIWGGALIYATSAMGYPSSSAKYGTVLIAWAFGFIYRWGEIHRRVRDAARIQRHIKKSGSGG